MSKRSVGTRLLYSLNVITALGGFAADWNTTHLFNPKWPPHAKFHDAMTITLGLLMGGFGIHSLNKARNSPDHLLPGALMPAAFGISQMSAFLYPNARGLEVEFPDRVPQVAGVYLNELPFATAIVLLSALGYALATTEDAQRRA